jgi:FlaA1/EpsC-like NDP-sugar epimerase
VLYRAVSKYMANIATCPRWIKQSVMLTFDFLALFGAVWLSYILRLGPAFMPNMGQLLLMLCAPVIALPVFLRAGLYLAVVRYVGEHALWAVVKAVVKAALLWAFLAYMSQMTGVQGVPRAVPVIYALLGVALVGGSRFAARWLIGRTKRPASKPVRVVLIYGAGGAGRQLLASMRTEREVSPQGFIDDDVPLQGKDVDGLRVYAPKQLRGLIDRLGVRDVIVTMPGLSTARRKEVVAFLERHMVHVRILPALTDIVSGKHLVNMVREVDVGDLLGRDAVAADPCLLGQCIRDKVVLVTGAGGSIGSELCAQILSLAPQRLVLLESSEHALYQIERKLLTLSDCDIVASLGSVKDKDLLRRLLTKNQVQTIYHAAAHKHVPLVEANALEGVANNVQGTFNLAQAAYECGVESFVLISTDKAVRPANVMGATKRWAELVMQHFAQQASRTQTGQRFCAVRFGNVLGSSGSVIPLFKEQIARGGPVTVTHAEVTRYFMSIHEAVQLVIQSGSMARGGDIFLLDMGDPVKIVDLAHNMVSLAGRTVRSPTNPLGDIEIEVTGLRPGEKLYEELLIASSDAEGTDHPKIMRANETLTPESVFIDWLKQLQHHLDHQALEAVKHLLMGVAVGVDQSTSTAVLADGRFRQG